MRSCAHRRIAPALCTALVLAFVSACSGKEAPVATQSPQHAAVMPKPERLADGSPNWTGFWIPVGGLLESVLGGDEQRPKPVSPQLAARVKSDDPLALMKSPFKERYAESLRKEALGEPAYDPTALCFPPGMPRMMNMTYGMEILQTPGQIAVTSEWGPATRRLWLDRADHAPAEDLELTYSGDSLARWESDVLVVDTVGLRTDALINKSGLGHSEKLHLVERFSVPEPGFLLDEITVEDPVVFTAPWKIMRLYRYRPDLRLKEYVCQDNNQLMSINAKPPTP